MKKTFLILLFFCLITVKLFADDPDNIFIRSDPQNAEDIYQAHTNINLRTVDIKNKIFYFVTNDVHGYDQFIYNFRQIHVERIIAEDWFRRQDFETEELYNICRELRERIDRSPAGPMDFIHVIRICSNEKYGFLTWWWNEKLMFRYFFEIKTP